MGALFWTRPGVGHAGVVCFSFGVSAGQGCVMELLYFDGCNDLSYNYLYSLWEGKQPSGLLLPVLTRFEPVRAPRERVPPNTSQNQDRVSYARTPLGAIRATVGLVSDLVFWMVFAGLHPCRMLAGNYSSYRWKSP